MSLVRAGVDWLFGVGPGGGQGGAKGVPPPPPASAQAQQSLVESGAQRAQSAGAKPTDVVGAQVPVGEPGQQTKTVLGG